MKKCVVCAAGELYGRKILTGPGDFVIAADAGYKYLESQGITAGLIVGDFDSAELPPRFEYADNVVRLKREKDDTDTLAALRIGLERGCTEFVIYGGLGGRLDHTIANLQCLAFLSQNGCRATLTGDGCDVTAVTCGKLDFDASMRGTISVFAHGDSCRGVCERGLKYSLDNAELTSSFPIGVSNEFTGAPSSVSVVEGTLIIVYSVSVDKIV